MDSSHTVSSQPHYEVGFAKKPGLSQGHPVNLMTEWRSDLNLSFPSSSPSLNITSPNDQEGPLKQSSPDFQRAR